MDFLIQQKRVSLIEKYVPAGSTVLDIGCGYYPENLAALEHKIKLGVGIDRDIPDKPLSEKISFIKADIKKELPLPDNAFEIVILLAVLEHLDHPAEVIAECYRVLTPGGRLIITIPSNYSRPLLEALANPGLISREEIFDHKHYFNRKEVDDLLTQARFKIMVSKPYNLFLNSLFVAEK